MSKVKGNIHVFYCKCIKPKKYQNIHERNKERNIRDHVINKFSAKNLNEVANKFKFTNKSSTIYGI